MKTVPRRVQRRSAPPSRQRGAAAVIAAFALLALVPVLALSMNIGQLYYAQRDLNKQATLAALSAVQVSSGCANGGEGLSATLDLVRAEVQKVITDNNGNDAAAAVAVMATGINGKPSVELGRIESKTGRRIFEPLSEGDVMINAVRVNLTRPQPVPFINLYGDRGLLYASATAQQAPIGVFNVSSGLASLNGGVVNALLGGLLCAPGDTACQNSIVSLNVVNGAQGLLNTSVSLGQLATAFGVSVADLSDPLTLSATTPLGDVLDGLVASLGDTASSSAISLLQGLANAASNPNDVALGQLLGAVDGLGGDAPIVNLFDLLIALGAATENDPDNPDAVTPINLPLSVLGVATVSTFITILEPPKLGMGRPGQAQASTAQIKLLIRVQAAGTFLSGLKVSIETLLNDLLLGSVAALTGIDIKVDPLPSNLNLGIDVTVAGGAASLEGIQCPRSGVNGGKPIANLDARTAAAMVEVGTFSGNASSAPALNASQTSFPLTTIKIDATCVGLSVGKTCLGLNLGSTTQTLSLGLTGAGVGETSFAPLNPVDKFNAPVPPAAGQPTIYVAKGVPPEAPVPGTNPQTRGSPTTVDLELKAALVQTSGSGLTGALSGLVTSLLTGITGLLNPLLGIVNGLTASLVDPLLAALGIQLGTATVTTNAVQISQPMLVTNCIPGTALCP